MNSSGADPASTVGPVTLLDCTLRDGGYHNDWDFPTDLVERYLAAIARAGVPVAEVGFRSGDVHRYAGPTAFTTDDYLATLDLPERLTLGVMVNAKELVAGSDPRREVGKLFGSAASSPVALVRIAAHYAELARLAPAVDELHRLGYRVGVNLMQIDQRSTDDIAAFGRCAAEWGIEVAYFADSLGGMRPDDVGGIVRAIRAGYDGAVGCHMHDSMTLAFANTLAAIDAGATWVDATLLGMGRGPGNVRTEHLAIDLARRGLADLDSVPLLELVTGDFAQMQREYGWGTNVFYFLSAAFGVHPTYIQEMTRDGVYSAEEIIAALDELREAGGASFSQERLDAAAASRLGFDGSGTGTWDARGWCAGRDVLVIGPGPEGWARRDDVERYVRRARPAVVALNVQAPIDPALVDLLVQCHPVRAVIDADRLGRVQHPIAMPRAVLDRLVELPAGIEVRDFGMRVVPGVFDVCPTGCTVPRVLAAAYAFALATVGGARRILLTGFDGFEPRDPRQEEMLEVFDLLAGHPGAPPVVALTRTRYPIGQSSLYAP